MAKAAKPENANLKQYATKIDAKTKKTLDLIVQLRGAGFGQRELLNEFLELYREKHPEEMAKVDKLIELMGVE
ncbi:hypothetical protein ACF5W4_11005 [Bacillota bacterium Lsc_1132]